MVPVRPFSRSIVLACSVSLGALLGAGWSYAADQSEPGASVLGRRSALPPATSGGEAVALPPGPSTRQDGSLKVVVRLSAPSVVEMIDENAIAANTTATSRGRQSSARNESRTQQTRVQARAARLGAQTLARLEKSMNALVMQVDVSTLPLLRGLPEVVSVTPVGIYQTPPQDDPASGSLAQAAQYLEAAEPRARGFDGTGVTVALFDSGIDFTHKSLGGPGTSAFYTECYLGAGTPPAHTQPPAGACASFFGPNAPKVVGGYDFVGEAWPGEANPERPDPNPIDFQGHGTHVADIVGGRSADGSHEGLAPGVRLYAYKVCSAVSPACSGLAVIQAVEAALDPNNDGDFDDTPDIWNFSLGSPYGQPQDDLSFALDNVVRAGVVVLGAAGNDGDKPWIVASPSAAKNVISVAQTSLPDAVLYRVVVNYPAIAALPDNVVRTATWQPWSAPLTTAISADLVRPAGPLGCTEADFAGFVTGAIALIDRGVCNASVKISLAKTAGAVAALIANNVPGPPPVFAFGGGDPSIPAFSVTQADGNALKSAPPPVNVTLDPANVTRLSNTTVASSARGPSIGGERVKPDLGAPGAWLSAQVGTGDRETSFGGTSGATPTVAGAAAILVQRFANAAPLQIKRRLINNAADGNRTFDAEGNSYPTAITRIGGGELRIAPALASETLVGDIGNGQGNLSFGLQDVTGRMSLTRTLRIRNTSSQWRRYTFTPTFRDAADKALNAAAIYVPPFSLGPKSQADVPVYLFLFGGNLNPWPFVDPTGFGLAGLLGNNGSLLNAPEIDGYLRVGSNSGDTVHVGWHVLPRRAAWMTSSRIVNVNRFGTGVLRLENRSSVENGLVEVFSLTGTSDRYPRPEPGDPGSNGSNQAVVDLAGVGIRDFIEDGVIQFGISTFGRRKTPITPALFIVEVDITRDGTPEYLVYNAPFNNDLSDGRSVVNVYDVATRRATTYRYTDADFDSANIVLTAPLQALGLAPGTTFDADVFVYDYFDGLLTDAILDMTWTVGERKHLVTEGETLSLPPHVAGAATVRATGTETTSTQSGFLLMFRSNRDPEFELVSVPPPPVGTTTAESKQQ